jgi:C-terminal processing protease CtpA/Prc
MTELSGPTTFTSYSKLGIHGESVFADDASFEQQYAEGSDDDYNLQTQLKSFEVRAPPGQLGMVVDTPNGGVPVVRAIKPDSILAEYVQIGDRLISVDRQDVTDLTALEVTSLISVKQHQPRVLLFCRLSKQKGHT